MEAQTLVIWLEPQKIWVDFQTGCDINGVKQSFTSEDVAEVRQRHSGESFVDFVKRVKTGETLPTMLERLKAGKATEADIDAAASMMASHAPKLTPKDP